MTYISFILSLLLFSCLAYVAWHYLRRYFVVAKATPVVLPYLSPEVATGPIDNHTKGVAFENFVVGKFNREFFELQDWRGDKGYQGIYPVSSKYPDLHVRYKPNNVEFAVECKWRQNFYEHHDKNVDDQINNYKTFSAEKKLKVFIVIGIGGTPHYPDNLYVVPLRAVSGNRPLFSTSFLEDCKKKPGNFFLNPKTIQLK